MTIPSNLKLPLKSARRLAQLSKLSFRPAGWESDFELGDIPLDTTLDDLYEVMAIPDGFTEAFEECRDLVKGIIETHKIPLDAVESDYPVSWEDPALPGIQVDPAKLLWDLARQGHMCWESVERPDAVTFGRWILDLICQYHGLPVDEHFFLEALVESAGHAEVVWLLLTSQ